MHSLAPACRFMEKLKMVDQALSQAIITFFLDIPIFERINAQEIKLIADQMNVLQLSPGDTLFREADPAGFMCFIEQGTLKVTKRATSGDGTVLLATLSRGQSIGEMSVIENLPRSATAQAMTPARLFILSRPAFELILERYPDVGNKLLKGIALLLSRHLRHTSEQLAMFMPLLD